MEIEALGRGSEGDRGEEGYWMKGIRGEKGRSGSVRLETWREVCGGKGFEESRGEQRPSVHLVCHLPRSSLLFLKRT